MIALSLGLSSFGAVCTGDFSARGDVETAPDRHFHDDGGFKCWHKLVDADHANADHHDDEEEPHRSVHGAASGHALGFETFYVDTLGARGTAPLHDHDAEGAELGVISGSDTRYGFTQNVFEIKASGIDGLIAVCTMPLVVDEPSEIIAHARIYIT